MSHRHVRFGYGTFAAACAAAALSLSGIAHADTINVPAGGDIQAAINGASDGDVIQLEAGEYFPAATLDTNGKEVTIIGTTDPKTGEPTSIIDGQASIRVLFCGYGETALTVFENLLITGGYTSSSGGGMFNLDSSPTLTNCTFEGNSADYSGGGMYSVVNSSPTLTGCTFTDNQAGSGGGMYNDDSSPTLTNCTFEGNSSWWYGGGMRNAFSSSPTLTDCAFTDNSASYGGGMSNDDYSSPTLTNCTFTGNSVDDGDNEGGGMHNENNSSPTLTGCTFTDNSANYRGGGMYCSGESPTLENCTFEGNSAAEGGGMFCHSGNSPTLTGCTFTNNSAHEHDQFGGGGGSGGGMFNYHSSPALTDCTFTGNYALKNGGGMYNNNSIPTLTNTTVCSNTPDQINGSWTDNGGNWVAEECPEDCLISGVLSLGETPFDTTPAVGDVIDLEGYCDFVFGLHQEMHNSLYYSFTPDCNDVYTFSTCNTAEFDTRIAILEGTCEPSATLACNDDVGGCEGYTSELDAVLEAGLNYVVVLGGYLKDDFGMGILRVSRDCPTDFNNDGLVDAADLGLLLADWGNAGETDANCDGTTDAADLGIVLAGWGSCP
jgi:parallel beta-helix repeat protein